MQTGVREPSEDQPRSRDDVGKERFGRRVMKSVR